MSDVALRQLRTERKPRLKAVLLFIIANKIGVRPDSATLRSSASRQMLLKSMLVGIPKSDHFAGGIGDYNEVGNLNSSHCCSALLLQ